MSTSARPAVAGIEVVRARRARIDLLPYILIAPAVVLVLIVTVYPALYAVQISTTNANMIRMATMRFVGAANYVNAFDDEIFVIALGQTVRWVIVNASGQMALALPVALLLNSAFRGRAAVRAGILVPWVVPGAVVAIIWRYMVDANYGVVNDILLRLGAIVEPIAWIGEPLPSFVVLSTATIWAGFPFFAITLLAALQAIPEDLYEAARIDGAGAWQRFRTVTLPLLLPTILLLLLLRMIWLSHSIDLIFLMTNGGPGYNNYTIAVYSFILTWSQLELGYPSAMVIMLSAVLLVASAFYIRSIEQSREWM
ncbi:MAG: sugar ABC transporter permease [Chloroflexi bacterium]|nr:sugar ABC transporter permease [Chloroflexota bacterium]